MIWFDLFHLQSSQLVEHSCSARMNWDLNKVIIIIKLLRVYEQNVSLIDMKKDLQVEQTFIWIGEFVWRLVLI